MSSKVELDPYIAGAQNDNVTPTQKLEDLQKLVRGAQTGMLTTRASSGHLHARAMTPAGQYSGTQINLVFIANNASPKFKEIKNDSHANVSFCDASSTNWASYSGTAKVIEDRAVVKKYWSSDIAPYFGNLGDNVHKGDENDPRVALIEVVPDEVHYWLATGCTDRGTPMPGELRTITKQEIELIQASEKSK